MINGTLFYSISTTLNMWEVWKVIRDFNKREQFNPLKCNLKLTNGISTYVQKSEFTLEYQDSSKYPESLHLILGGKVKLKCLNIIDTPLQKCIYFQVTTDHMNFVTSYSLRSACETTVLFVRVSNIEISDTFEKNLSNILQPSLLDQKYKLVVVPEEKVDALNETIPLTQKNNPLTSNNKSIIHGPSEIAPIISKSKLELKDKEKSEKPKSIKQENPIKVVEDIRDYQEINKVDESISAQIEIKEKDNLICSKAKKLHESKVFEVAKSILSFERGNMLSIIKAITKEKSKVVQFQESKMIKANYKTLANVVGDIKSLLSIANNSSGFYYKDKREETPIYTILDEKEVKTKENKTNKSYTLRHNYLEKKMIFTYKSKQINSYEAAINYIIDWDIEQDFVYRIKRLSDEFCFILLTVNMRGEDLEAKIKKHKTDQYMRFILCELEKQIHKFG